MTTMEIFEALFGVVVLDVVSALGESLFLSTEADDEITPVVVAVVVESVEGSMLGLGVAN